jgi:hypothetical protein
MSTQSLCECGGDGAYYGTKNLGITITVFSTKKVYTNFSAAGKESNRWDDIKKIYLCEGCYFLYFFFGFRLW